MLSAEVTVAEPAVADDALGLVFAVLKAATNLLGGHAATDGESEVQGGTGCDMVVGECRVSGGEMFPSVDEAQVVERKVCSESEKGFESRDGGCLRYGKRNCWKGVDAVSFKAVTVNWRDRIVRYS